MVDKTTHPMFYEHARDVMGSQGLAPGFPQQFSYVENAHQTKATKEQININLSSGIGILQGQTRFPNIGPYRSMVEDIPFDMQGEEKTQAQLASVGFLSIFLGILASQY